MVKSKFLVTALVRRVFRVSLLAVFLLVGIAATGTQVVAQDAKKFSLRFPTSELSKLPYFYFCRNNLGEACLIRMEQKDSTIEIDGKHYIGFQFWSTGLVEWLFINTPSGLEPDTWLLVNDRGEPVDRIQPTDIALDDCPRILTRYPLASRVTRYKTGGEALDTRGRYHLLQRISPGKPASYAISLRSSSPRSYEAGLSGKLIKTAPGPHITLRSNSAGSNEGEVSDESIKTTPKPRLRPSSDVVIENMKAMRHEKGVKAAVDYLAREMEVRLDDQENASSLPAHHRNEARGGYLGVYINAWSEAQTGGGRLDADWAAAVYGAMYEVCLKRGYFARADVAVNLTASLMLAGRHGKLAEVFEVWKDGMRLGGYRMDTSIYPDLGPAFAILPQVRKRKIPHLTPYANARGQMDPFNDRPHALNNTFLGCFENYATHLWFQGQWQESLEWLAWANAWSSDPKLGDPLRGRGERWHHSLSEIADKFSSFGFWEQALALHENALQQKITGGAEGKYKVRHQMSCLKLKMLMGQGLSSDSIDKARLCIDRAAGNLYDKQESVQAYRADLGELLIHVGRISEGEALLDKLAATGSRNARVARLKHWVKTGRIAGVEAELRQLLEQSRETGRKMDEIVFYRLYADFLELQGRLGEALRVRRELVRLCRAFDLFTYLPVEMAKLAGVLNQLGNWDESLQLTNQTRQLLGEGRIPEHLAQKALAILDDIVPGEPVAAEMDPAIRVEFQPLESIIIPLKGASWLSHITLTNPSGTDQSGTLQATGLPVRFRELDSEVDILASLGGLDGAQKLKVQIEPASYKVISINASNDFTGHGQFSLSWTPDNGGYHTESRIQLEEAIGGVTKAIIQAGGYQLNPFYGIQVYHHYLDTEASEYSQPMRFVSSQNARIEVYGMDGAPIAIDGQGNGSLQDQGDELFGSGDGHGNLRLSLATGSSSFMIVIYPQKELEDDGLSLRIECLVDNQWELYAEDHLMPAPADD